MLRTGVPIEHPPADAVARARKAFADGTASPGDFNILMRKAAADARSMLATAEVAHPSLSLPDWDKHVLDLDALSWYCVRGRCGTGRDNIATSLGTLVMDADQPVTVHRYQAKEVFGVNKHAFAVVMVKDEPGWAFILDPTFGQFMRPSGRRLAMQGATANFLQEHPTGAVMARDLLRDGFIPLTEENAALYARAMGVPEDQVEGMQARLLAGDTANLTELIGGRDRRPPVTHIENVEALSVEELQAAVSKRVDELTGRGGGDQTIRQHLEDFRKRLDDALQRGPVRPKSEGGPSVTPPATKLAPPRVPGGEREPPEPEAGSAPTRVPRATEKGSGLITVPPEIGGTAASRFRTDVLKEPEDANLTITRSHHALDKLAETNGPLKGTMQDVSMSGGPLTYRLKTRDGPVEVTIRAVEKMPQAEGGIPVARYEFDKTTGTYRVDVSRRADPAHIESALAHEFAKILEEHGLTKEMPSGQLSRTFAAEKQPPERGAVVARTEVLDTAAREGAEEYLPRELRPEWDPERQLTADERRSLAAERYRIARERRAEYGRRVSEALGRQRAEMAAQRLRDILAGIAADLNLRGAEHSARIFDDMVDGIVSRSSDRQPLKGRRPATGALVDALRGRTSSEGLSLEGMLLSSVLDENVAAIRSIREHIRSREIPPDAVFGVERGGFFLAEVLGYEDADLGSRIVHAGKGPSGERTGDLERLIRAQISLGQRQFIIVDFYMGGHAAGEFNEMYRRILADAPDAHFEIPLAQGASWLRTERLADRTAA